MNKKADIRNLAERNEVKYAYSSHDKLKHTFHKYLGRDTALQEGVENMARWVQEVGPGKSPEFKHIEVSKNLPDSWRS